MSAAQHRSPLRAIWSCAPPEKPRTRGFLHIVRHGSGGGTMYVVTYHSLDRNPHALGQLASPMLAEGATTSDRLARSGSASISVSAKSARRSKTFFAWAPPTFPTSGSPPNNSSKKA